MAYLGERVLPRLRATAGAELVDELLVTNPRRLLARPPLKAPRAGR